MSAMAQDAVSGDKKFPRNNNIDETTMIEDYARGKRTLKDKLMAADSNVQNKLMALAKQRAAKVAEEKKKMDVEDTMGLQAYVKTHAMADTASDGGRSWQGGGAEILKMGTSIDSVGGEAQRAQAQLDESIAFLTNVNANAAEQRGKAMVANAAEKQSNIEVSLQTAVVSSETDRK